MGSGGGGGKGAGGALSNRDLSELRFFATKPYVFLLQFLNVYHAGASSVWT